jgi:hypothetical protein
MQGLFLLGSKTKESSPIINVSWEKSISFYCEFFSSLLVLHSPDVYAMNYCHTNSQSITRSQGKMGICLAKVNF